MTDRETRHKIKRKKKIKFYFNNYERTRYEEIRWKIKIENGIKINLDKLKKIIYSIHLTKDQFIESDVENFFPLLFSYVKKRHSRLIFEFKLNPLLLSISSEREFREK